MKVDISIGYSALKTDLKKFDMFIILNLTKNTRLLADYNRILQTFNFKLEILGFRKLP